MKIFIDTTDKSLVIGDPLEGETLADAFLALQASARIVEERLLAQFKEDFEDNPQEVIDALINGLQIVMANSADDTKKPN